MTWKITNNKEWSALEKEFSWVADMKHVPQSKIHHAEGNVDIHTQMVLDKLQYINDYSLLTEQERELLWAATLLHDVEKRSTTVDEGNGNITAAGHARKGEHTARTILYQDIETPFQIREQIASLVRYHGLPLWLLEKEKPQQKVVEASLRLNTNHLAILSEADVVGRICDDTKGLIDNVQMFREYCKETNCWNKAREFASNHARYCYFNTENSYIDYVPFDDFKCQVTLLSGLPGMGKDYYIRSLNRDIPVISLDDIRRKYKINPTDSKRNGWVVQEAKEQARIYLRAGQDFVWNATNITQLMRKQLIDLFTSYGAYVKIVYIEKPYRVWRKQNRDRNYPLPENVLDRMLSKLEIPQQTEAHEIQYIVE